MGFANSSPKTFGEQLLLAFLSSRMIALLYLLMTGVINFIPIHFLFFIMISKGNKKQRDFLSVFCILYFNFFYNLSIYLSNC